MTLRVQETEVVEYISELCHVFDEQTVGRQIKLHYLHDMDELTALIDPNNFDKVILNVLSNALNFYTRSGNNNCIVVGWAQRKISECSFTGLFPDHHLRHRDRHTR